MGGGSKYRPSPKEVWVTKKRSDSPGDGIREPMHHGRSVLLVASKKQRKLVLLKERARVFEGLVWRNGLCIAQSAALELVLAFTVIVLAVQHGRVDVSPSCTT